MKLLLKYKMNYDLVQNIKLKRLAFLVSTFLFTSVYGQPITNKNWVNHPSIMEIRKIYTQVENLILEDSLKKETLRDTGETYISETNGYIDLQNNMVRKVKIGYSEDFCMVGYHWDVNAYYDKSLKGKDGPIRFIYATYETDDGRKAEYRKYFDPKGIAIWVNKKIIKSNTKDIPDDIPPTYIIQEKPSSYFKRK